MKVQVLPKKGAYVVLAFVLVFGLFLSACSVSTSQSGSDSSNSVTSTGSGQWPRTIDTDDGELTLVDQPTTIVSTSTTLTGSLLAVGAPVVATAATTPNIDELSDDQGFLLSGVKLLSKQTSKSSMRIVRQIWKSY
ncbi:iron-enterobactin transporter periplasmic binding protein [Corynebacterium kutscheri]|uniref:Iron-enterobactin transporter periplasmic binding protein n=1 Tax=Corynebacterium kutscheri TaxID=35755 RepID=A0AB38VTS5_9CORY|nr:hypothetical protein [Corynebacterium kutscheri]VEH08866.1 iron-enterobactin transporter periplasmic binding protein [Corynebacterium kutscheri]VEH09911.1 iron-enterobactin transporter periplasmic binding protein [Corynebacterium kutscheri]VEH79995.1 iron-enterobactin transporter periplasmic binding protein [Corynebacterium kutscheri]